ncbi:MAG: S-layer protein domain-containing protein [Methanocellales archaeon]
MKEVNSRQIKSTCGIKMWRKLIFYFILIIVLFSTYASCTLITHPKEYAVYIATRDEGVANAIGASEYSFLKWQSKNYSAINNELTKLAEIIFEQEIDDEKLLREGEEWKMGENYSLKVVSIDLAEKKARMQFLHNSTVLKDSIVGTILPNQSTFIYKRKIAGVPNVPQFICYLHDVFHGIDASLVVIKYVFLISEQTISLPSTIPFLKTSPKLYTAYEATGRDINIANAIGAMEYHYLKWQSADYVAIAGDPSKLARIIVNQSLDEEKILSEGEIWQLGEDYSLRIASIDVGKKLAWLQFYRDEVKLKEEIKGGTAPVDNIFVYKTTIAWTGNVPQFICYLGDILQTTNKSYVAIKYTFLISNETVATLSAEIKVNPQQITPAQKANITITVASDTEPVANARILLNISDGSLQETVGLTDRNGSFSTTFTSNTSGNFTLNAVVEKVGYINTSAQASIVVMPTPLEILNQALAMLILIVIAVIGVILWFNQKLKIYPLPREIPADGVSSARIVIESINYFKFPKPVKSNTKIELSTTIGTLPSSILIPKGSSRVETALIASKEVGTAEIVAKADDLKARAKVIFIAPELFLKLSAEPNELPADGKSISTITIRIEDKNGNPFMLPRERIVHLSTTLGTIGSPIKIARDSAVATATLIAPIVSGRAKITVNVEDLSESIEIIYK